MRQKEVFRTCLATVLPLVFASTVVLAAIRETDEKDEEEPVKTRKLEIADDLVTEVPVTWKAQKATSRFRIHQFELPRAKGDKADGNLVFFHFGKGGGGGLEANLKRWYGMVEPAEASKGKPKPKQIESDGVKITWLDLAGTYLDRPTPFSQEVTRRGNYRMFAAYIDAGADGPYYVRAFGPDQTMLAQREAVEKMLKGIKGK